MCVVFVRACKKDGRNSTQITVSLTAQPSQPLVAATLRKQKVSQDIRVKLLLVVDRESNKIATGTVAYKLSIKFCYLQISPEINLSSKQDTCLWPVLLRQTSALSHSSLSHGVRSHRKWPPGTPEVGPSDR